MTKAEAFEDMFQEDAAELFLKTDDELLEWLESEYTGELMDRFFFAMIERVTDKINSAIEEGINEDCK